MLWLFLAFIVLPVLEIWLITQVAGQLGWPLAIFSVVAISLAGAWLVRREGIGVIRRVRGGFQEGRLPTSELADGAMIFFASALMLTPGFLTDALGLALLIPPIRAVLRPPVMSFFRRRLEVRVGGIATSGFGPAGFGTRPPGPARRDDVMDVDGRPHDDDRPGPGDEGAPDPGDQRPELS